ncbi:MAG: hypothetical protein HND27_02725 [Bacteroidetes bacterium]|jgi:hypothetical protein|nr:hypothetical protein [Bacteroidota bacterium]MBV6462448.1 hypothetical protein [Flavobacteriales bacterium]WKZ74385.1 MAG: hypothetical protein QY303_09545 [Vicingaceae bacterium]MCL4816994.1 hypothetical protein [Flavobacteriales bacterium]NOG94673.1 hypothetical protein [Bacteroidota bacterium]
MRVLASVPHPHCLVSIFSFNEKYIVKLEFGNCAIEYKIKNSEVSGLDEIKKKLTPEFIDSFADVFMTIGKKFKNG